MTQAYTVRQLEFFHTALNIINAAIVDAEPVTVPEKPIVSEAATPTTIGTPAAPIVPISETHQSPVLTDPGDTKTSAVFFNALPWQTPAPQTARTPSPPTPPAPLAQEATAKSFFHGLPWQGNTTTGDVTETVKHLDVSSIAGLATQTALQAAQKGASLQNQLTARTASGYFQSLPW